MLLTQSAESCYRASTVESRSRAVQRVITSMHEQMNEKKDDPLSLHELAEIAILSPYHFNRVFRQVTGIPPTQFQYALRLQAAKRLLLTTNFSVTDVCFEVGYNSLGTFTMRFTKLVGLPPRSLRQMAAHFDSSAPKSLAAQYQCAPRIHRASGNCVRGRVAATDEFDGLIFIGLFDAPIPQSPPTACTLLTAPGDYRIEHVPNGRYYLFAAGLRWSENATAFLLGDSALRAHAGPLLVFDGQTIGQTDISLHAPQLTDPPILVALPLLLINHAAQQVAVS